MADDQLAGTGHRGQVWLSTDQTAANLERINQVKSFSIPRKLREFLETTHLDSDAKEYAPALPDFDEFDIVTNYRPGSDTDLALQDAADDDDPRLMRLMVPVRGVLTRQISFLCYLTYAPADEVEAQTIMESTATVRVTGGITIEPYAAP
jgi:hypothetical protein